MSGSAYNTFPRSARDSPAGSGANTPTRNGSSAIVSSPTGAPSPIPIPSRESIYVRLTRRISHGQGNDAGDGASSLPERSAGQQRWDEGRYRDVMEQVKHQGDPTSWMVLHAAIASSSSDASGPELRSPHERGSSPVGGKKIARKQSRNSLLLGSGFSGRQREGSAAPTITEEPDSYAELGPAEADDHSFALPSPRKSIYSIDRQSPAAADAESESDSDSDDDSPPRKPTSTPASVYRRIFPLSPIVKNVIKCVIAYFLAEMWTFVPVLTDALGSPFDVDGPVKNAHVVATVAVYFYPARTIGSMIEATFMMVAGSLYAAFLCCGSMGMSVLLDRYELQKLGHLLVLIFWLGGGYALLAYVKVTINKPTATTACSMVSLISSVIITKEGAYHIGRFQSQAILQVLIIVAIGSLISNIVCFLLWPSSATSKLQVDLNKTLSSFSTLLEMLTKTFLLDDNINTRPTDLKKAIDAHQSSYTTLKASLAQAKFEFFDSRLAARTSAYDDVVDSMLRLSQGLTGMRVGCTLQYELMQAEQEGWLRRSGGGDLDEGKDGKMRKLREELIVLEKFKERVGPSLQSLATISKRTLAHLRTSFIRTKSGQATLHALEASSNGDIESGLDADGLLRLKAELDSSLLLFKREHSRAIKLLYRTLPAETVYSAEELEEDVREDPFADPRKSDDKEGSGMNDNLFRIFHFCFNMEEWTKELSVLIDEFVVIRTTEQEVERTAIQRKQRWGLLAPVATLIGGIRGATKRRKGRGRRAKATVQQRASSLRERFTNLFTSRSENPFPQIEDGALTSHQHDSQSLTYFGRIKQSIWMLGWRLRQPSVRFAIKTGAGAALLASAAFTGLRPLWLEWRGEWALISYMVVSAPSLGATNFLAFGRILGTITGAAAAVLCYTLFPENAVMLPLLGALVSVPCFYVIVTRPKYGPSSRFVLLTFNLTALYAFNLREVGPELDVIGIGIHRTIAVVAGVAYALFINVYIWPYEARRELRRGLSDYFLNAAHLYLSLVSQYSSPPEPLISAGLKNGQHDPTSPCDVTESTALLSQHLDRAEEECVRMEVHLQQSLIKLQGLLAATVHEPRLKGPFPVAAYSTILQSCQTILDLLTSIGHVTTRESWYSSVRRDFVVPVNKERREMVGNVLLYFSLLASALTLKTPLPAYLPPAAEARLALVRKLRTLEVVKKRIVRGGSEGLLYLGYALTMKDVIAQLDLLGRTFQSLFGIVGGASSTEEFEALFAAHDDSDNSEVDDGESSSEESQRS